MAAWMRWARLGAVGALVASCAGVAEAQGTRPQQPRDREQENRTPGVELVIEVPLNPPRPVSPRAAQGGGMFVGVCPCFENVGWLPATPTEISPAWCEPAVITDLRVVPPEVVNQRVFPPAERVIATILECKKQCGVRPCDVEPRCVNTALSPRVEVDGSTSATCNDCLGREEVAAAIEETVDELAAAIGINFDVTDRSGCSITIAGVRSAGSFPIEHCCDPCRTTRTEIFRVEQRGLQRAIVRLAATKTFACFAWFWILHPELMDWAGGVGITCVLGVVDTSMTKYTFEYVRTDTLSVCPDGSACGRACVP